MFQIALYIEKFSATLQSALAYPRTDVSTLDKIIYDPRFSDQTTKELGKLAPLKMWEPTAFRRHMQCRPVYISSMVSLAELRIHSRRSQQLWLVSY